MADIVGGQLTSELTRVIECPYPASLSHFAELLAGAPILTVRACLRQQLPCAVSRLARLVCEALPQWAYTLHILSSLCHSPEFVDTLLLQYPGLLDALLTKANSSPREFEEYAELCVLLLSRPLPASVLLPSSAQIFFTRIFEKARQDPDTCTLKPLYFMLNGACRGLLSLLDTQRRDEFDQELSRILSSKGLAKNYMLMLWCFGIALLAENAVETVDQQGPESSMGIIPASLKKHWATASGRKMFGDSGKICKTISLTYLSAICATKGEEDVPDEDAVEGIQIAVRTLQCVDLTILREWPRSSSIAKSTFTKLPEKILRSNINPAVQLEAMCLYSMVAGDAKLPSDIVAQYERCLTNVADLAHSDRFGETLSVSLPVYSSRMHEGFFHTFLAKVLDACIMPVDSCFSASYASLVEQMTIALPLCDSLRGKILLVASASEMQDKIWKLLQFQFEEKHSDCRAYTASLHQPMMSATIALLLNLAITTQTPGPSLPVQLATALINKQRQLPLIATQCSHEMATTKPAVVSLFQQKSTPYTGQHLQDWRERLNSDIENHATFQRDSIVRSVAQICQDLEARCNTVEEPLRRERQKTQELQQHIAQLNERISSLKVQADDDRCYLDGLEDEKNTILEENDGLSAKLNDLQAKFEEASRNADETLRRVREDFNAKELELRSTLLSCEETIHTHEEKSEAQIRMVRNLEHDLGQAQDERASLGEQIETLQRQLEDAEKKLESETENGRTQSEEATRLSNRHIELELQLQGTEAELDAITTRLSDLQVSYRELVDSSEDAYKDLEHKHVRDMEAATVQARDDRAKLDAKLQETLHNGQRAEDAYEETRRDLQKLQASVPPLEERIQELIDICSEQEEELEELRTLRKNVLAQLTVQPTANRSASRGPTDSDGPRPHRAPREHRRRKSALQDPDTVPKGSRSTQNAASTAGNVVNASFSSSDSYSSQNGSTPKRLKPWQSFKVPAMHTPHNQKPLFGSRSTSKKLSPTRRSALRQLSPNRRHTVGFAVPENEEEQPSILRSGRKRRGSLRDVEEADFEMEDFLAGTPLTPGNFVSGTGRIPNDDEATATEL